VATMDSGERRLLYAQESPVNVFEDFGSAELIDGMAEVIIEPLFAQAVNTGQEYHVFLTPHADCKGLYVGEMKPGSFVVRELQGGQSDVSFSYRIVAKRRGYENLRMEQANAAPDPQRTKVAEPARSADVQRPAAPPAP